MDRLRFTAAVLWPLALASALLAGEGPGQQVKIETGKPAPEFTLKDQDGKEVKLAEFKGKKSVLLAFYPRDFTGG